MKTQKAANKKARILEAAAKVLAEKGYSLTTLADIGSEAGTFAGSLYYYFSCKEQIVEEVLNIGTTSVSKLVMDKYESLPVDMRMYDKIVISLETHLQQMLAKDDFVLAYWKIIDQVPEEIRVKHIELPRRYGHFWQRILLEAQEAGEIRSNVDSSLVRLLLIGSTIYALQWYKPGGRNTPREIADVLAEMFFLGMVPRQALASGTVTNPAPSKRPAGKKAKSTDAQAAAAPEGRHGSTGRLGTATAASKTAATKPAKAASASAKAVPAKTVTAKVLPGAVRAKKAAAVAAGS